MDNKENTRKLTEQELELAIQESEKQKLEMQRAQLTSADFDATDPSKYFGNVPVLVTNEIKDVSKDTQTPMMGMLEAKNVDEYRSTSFNMITEALDSAAPSNFKIGENDDGYNPTPTISRKTNDIMTMGVLYSRKRLAKIITQVPNSASLDEYRIRKNLQALAIAMEYYLFVGSKANPNETDGIITILQREALLGNAAPAKTYNQVAGSNLLKRQDIENMLFSILVTAQGKASDLIFMPCELAFQTISKWFDDKIMYTTNNLFTFNGETPVYQSIRGPKIPMIQGNQVKVTSLADKLLILDMAQISKVRLNAFANMVDMPISKPHDEVNVAFLDSLGLNFLHTLTSGYIEGIDA